MSGEVKVAGRRRSERGALVACAWLVLALLTAVAAHGHSDEARRVRLTFPLWRDVPVRQFAALRQGNFRGTQWGAYIFRDSGHGGDSRHGICVDLSKITDGGVHGNVLKCGPVVPRQGELPVYALIGRSGPTSESFVSMVLPLEVSSVRLSIEPGPDIVRSAAVLGDRRQRKAHVGPLRYVAFALRKDICISSITAFDRFGRTVLDGITGECPLIG